MDFPRLLESQITGPLGLRDTAVALREDQQARYLQGHARRGKIAPPWERGAYEPAGGILSTAGDLLTYLETELHPERFPAFTNALRLSQELQAKALPGARIALAWMYRPETRAYEHGGATVGFTAQAFFCPKDDYAGVVLLNNWGGADVLGEHVRQRLAGEPAISLETGERAREPAVSCAGSRRIGSR